MNIREIQAFPTDITRADISKYIRPDILETNIIWHNAPLGWHESLLRSYQILQKVKELLGKGTPPDVVLELIEFMESRHE